MTNDTLKKENISDTSISEIRISYHNHKSYSNMPQVKCSKDAADFFKSVWSDRIEHVEEFMILLLNRSNKVLGFTHVSTGGNAGTVVDPKIIFQAALKANASSVILSHNHPSGSIKPSESDIRLTQKLKKAGTILDLPILDHIIVSKEDFYSMADDGIL